jgi:hypothetical protein
LFAIEGSLKLAGSAVSLPDGGPDGPSHIPEIVPKRSLRLGDLARNLKKVAMTGNAIAKAIVGAAFRASGSLRERPHVALIKDGITRIVNGLEEDDHAKSPTRTKPQT